MTRPSLSAVALVVLPTLVVACGGLRQAVQFDGTRQPRVAQPQQVAEAEVLPDGFEEAGRVSVHCVGDSDARVFDGEWLADADCSEERLVRALREAVSAAGAELLVARECTVLPSTLSASRFRLECKAELGRPSEALLAQRRSGAVPAPTAVVGYAVDEPRASEAWNIQVEVRPELRLARRAPVGLGQVAVLTEMPLGHVRLGDVIARCEHSCSRYAAQGAVRELGAHLGADAVVAVRCVAHAEGWLCTGTASGLARPEP